MKRSLKGLCKFLVLGLITIFTTVVIFRHVRPPRDYNSEYYKVRGVNPVPPPEKIVRLEKVETNQPLIVDNEVNNDLHSVIKIDWHNYKQIEEEKLRNGMFLIYLAD
jgi:hypothetical protein